MTTQCKDCRKRCTARGDKDPCKTCVHNNKAEQYTTCLDCGISCRYEAKPPKRQKGRVCPLCGRVSNLQEHHLLAGCNRHMADIYGLTINICPDCHTRIHHDPDTMRLFMAVGQMIFNQRYPLGDFATVFGKSYILTPDSRQAAQEILDKLQRREPIF